MSLVELERDKSARELILARQSLYVRKGTFISFGHPNQKDDNYVLRFLSPLSLPSPRSN